MIVSKFVRRVFPDPLPNVNGPKPPSVILSVSVPLPPVSLSVRFKVAVVPFTTLVPVAKDTVSVPVVSANGLGLLTEIVTVSMSVNDPPVPVWPLSFVVMVKVLFPTKFDVGT